MSICVEPEAVICEVKVVNEREFAAMTSILRNARGIPRTKLLIPNGRGGVVCRKTVFTWDEKLQAHPQMSNYRKDPRTKESLWSKGKPWNLHQVWCLQKVATFMQTPSIPRTTEGQKEELGNNYDLRTPTYEELYHHLWYQAENYTHYKFIEEYFKWRPSTTPN